MSETIGDKLGYMVLIPDYGSGKLEINYENKRSVRFEIGFCPICGRNLTKPAETPGKKDYAGIIRNNITDLINKQHISTRTLSEKTGIEEDRLQDLIAGKEAALLSEEMAIISDALNVSADRLLEPQ